MKDDLRRLDLSVIAAVREDRIQTISTKNEWTVR